VATFLFDDRLREAASAEGLQFTDVMIGK